MNTQSLYDELQTELSWWNNVIVHCAEQVTMDSDSNFMLDLAERKLAVITRSLFRVSSGMFGLCDACGGMIEPERLELLLDSDCYLCAACAHSQRRALSLPSMLSAC